MSKNYWELKPEDLNAKELQKYILDWYCNQVENWNTWGKIPDRETLASMIADVSQLNYALLLLDAMNPFEE